MQLSASLQGSKRSRAAQPSRRVTRGRWPLAFILPAAAFLALTSLYPLLRLVQMSVSDVTPATLRDSFWTLVGWGNFLDIFRSPLFGAAVINTVIYTAIVLVFSLGVGFIFAVALSSFPRLGRPLSALMLLVWLAPPVVSALVWKFIFAGNGIINSILEQLGVIHSPIGFLITGSLPLIFVALVNSWVTAPFATIIFRAALLDIPLELHEQASIDGASRAQKLRQIVIPLLRPTFLVLAILIFVYAFKSFDFVYAMTQGGPGTASTTLPFLSYRLAFSNFDYGDAAAIAVITMVLVAVAAIPYVRATRGEEL